MFLRIMTGTNEDFAIALDKIAQWDWFGVNQIKVDLKDGTCAYFGSVQHAFPTGTAVDVLHKEAVPAYLKKNLLAKGSE